MKVKGLKAVEQKLSELSREIPELSKAGLLAGAWDIVALSQDRTPVATGALKANQDAEPTKYGAVIRVRQNYAAAVHEDMNAYHKHGQAKFLESAMRDSIDDVINKAAKKAKQ